MIDGDCDQDPVKGSNYQYDPCERLRVGPFTVLYLCVLGLGFYGFGHYLTSILLMLIVSKGGKRNHLTADAL